MEGTGHAGHLDGLNDAQRAVARHGIDAEGGTHGDAGPLLVIAGAGTGKTNALAHRVAHLVLTGVAPERILLLTFSRRAAAEMARRAREITRRSLAPRGPARSSPPIRLPWAGTFHAIANRLLREYAANVGLPPTFSIMDRGDAADLMDVVRQELDLGGRERRFPRKETCLDIYSRSVSTRLGLEATLDRWFPWCREETDELRRLFRRYVELKQTSHALDYDDLLLYWRHMLEEPALASAVSARFDHILVDEYQDTNILQAEILLTLRPEGRGLTVVGDDAQAIYGFRAATVENILAFPHQFSPPARIVKLEENYRSTQPILDAANTLIAAGDRQYEKHLRATRRGRARPRYVRLADAEEEAAYVAGAVLENREQGLRLQDQAVLFRSAHHSDRLELELSRRNIPYVKYGGLRFLEAAHVKDLLALLRWAVNPRDRVSGFRALQLLPGIGPARAEAVFERLHAADYQLGRVLDAEEPPARAADDWPGFVACLRGIREEPAAWQQHLAGAVDWYAPQLERLYAAPEARQGDLEQLAAISARYEEVGTFLTELTLDPPSATSDLAGPPLLDEDFLVLSTVHSAKGQEWDAVFLLSVVDGHFPSEFAAGDATEVEEERRLLYVAMTRARDDLRLLTPLRFHIPGQRRAGDRHVYGARSRFLTPELLEHLETETAPRAAADEDGDEERPAVRLDIAARLRDMW